MRFYVLQVVVVALAMLVASGPVQAEWIDTFDGGFDQTWTSGNVTGLGGSSGSFSFTSVSNMLQVQDTTAPNALGAASGFGLVAEAFGEFLVSAVVNPANESTIHRDVGVLARMTGATPLAMSGYAFTIDYYDNSGVASITRIDAGLNTDGLESITLSPFTGADSVYMQFQGVGSTLVGSVYDQMGGTLLGRVIGSDAAYAAGFAGVIVNVSPENPPGVEFTIPLRGTYDMVSATIPEPSSVAMLISGCLCAFGLVWRRRQRQS